jgi:hypothetical protein
MQIAIVSGKSADERRRLLRHDARGGERDVGPQPLEGCGRMRMPRRDLQQLENGRPGANGL